MPRHPENRTRRQVVLEMAGCVAAPSLLATHPAQAATAGPHVVPLSNDPEFFVDDYLVDNVWATRPATQVVTRVFHQPRKHEGNPVIAGDGGYLSVLKDERAGLLRMVYQTFWDISYTPRKYTYGTAYAESTDGIHWKLPRIGKHLFKGTRDNNIVQLGPAGGTSECQYVLDLPEEQRRGYQYVMVYLTDDPGQKGMHLIGSQDAINWDPASDMLIAPDFTPDTLNTIVWDPRQKKYVMFGRATNIYKDGKSGLRRRVSRCENSELWGTWPLYPENILIPDEVDVKSGHTLFYGMPARYYAGIYWGFLWPFASSNPDDIYTELTFSRDGVEFHRFSNRPRLIDRGPEKAWDHGMVFGSPRWIEMNDEWWIYYSGTDQGHASRTVTPGIGFVRIRKEGFVSLQSPADGGFVVTRMLRWPGGKLYLNTDASRGELTVNVTGYDRKPVAGFAPEASLPITGNAVRQEVKWRHGDINALKGQAIRLEFTMKNTVDLYSFRAVPAGERP